jgi:hypothetical protein
MPTLSNAQFDIIVAHYAICGNADCMYKSFTDPSKHQEQIWGAL